MEGEGRGKREEGRAEPRGREGEQQAKDGGPGRREGLEGARGGGTRQRGAQGRRVLQPREGQEGGHRRVGNRSEAEVEGRGGRAEPLVTFEWLARICSISVLPDLGMPTTNMGALS